MWLSTAEHWSYLIESTYYTGLVHYKEPENMWAFALKEYVKFCQEKTHITSVGRTSSVLNTKKADILWKKSTSPNCQGYPDCGVCAWFIGFFVHVKSNRIWAWGYLKGEQS